jgi:hypothetical protein
MAKGKYTRTGTRRLGDEYQDLIALEVLLDWLEHTSRFKWVRVEADEAGFLDDVVALGSDDRLIVKQVKFSTDPESDEDPWTWVDLLDKPAGETGKSKTSLLEKWHQSLQKLLRQFDLKDASVVSNRKASLEVENCITVEGFIDFGRIPVGETKEKIIQQLGGEDEAVEFFSRIRFSLNQPDLPDLDQALQTRFRRLGGTELGWLSLKEELRSWVFYRHEPAPNGDITLADIRAAAHWYQLRSLPQDFEVPKDYVLPSEEFHQEFVSSLLARRTGGIVLTASPGAGKSTYSSNLYRELKEANIPVVRHHYFLSLADTAAAWRLEHQRAAESLMHDLRRDCAEALESEGVSSENPHPDNLREWLEACGRFYEKQGKALVVIVDGLDHVWRDTSSVDELSKLIRHMFPAPEGVVVLLGTQPVDDSQLPPLLLRAVPRSEWVSLPLLDLNAVEKWLRHHEDSLPRYGNDSVPDHVIERLAEAFFRKSSGHPLHLRYTLKALQERDMPMTEKNIERLPGCVHEDITAYYGDLWLTLPEESRRVLHLLAACRFPWTRQGLLECLDPEGHGRSNVRSALRQISHMLMQDELGLRAFHGSLLVFTQGLPEHEDYSSAMKSLALRWLRAAAPDYWRWAYEWTLEAELGNDEPIRQGPNRGWLIDALAKRRPRRQIEDILSRSTWVSIERGDLPRAVEVGLLRDYGYNAFQFDYKVLEALLYPQLKVADDPHLNARLRASLSRLKDGEIVLLAEDEMDRGNVEFVERCVDELSGRLRVDQSRSEDAWQTLLTSLVSVVAILAGAEPYKVLDFIVRNREGKYGARMLSAFAKELRTRREAGRLRLALDYRPDSSAGQGEELTPGERSILMRHAVLLSLEEKLDLDAQVRDERNAGDPFPAIYAVARKQDDVGTEVTTLPGVELLSLKRYQQRERADTIDDLFYNAFFGMLANHLRGIAERNERWLRDIGETSWAHRFMHELNAIARDWAQLFAAGAPPGLGWFYKKIGAVARPERSEENDIYVLGYTNAAEKAARQIGFDLLILSEASGREASISVQDLQTAFSSKYCNTYGWIAEYVAGRRRKLDADAVSWLIASQVEDLASAVEEFPERAWRFAVLAGLAVLHGLEEEGAGLIREAASNQVAHGNHKDMLFFAVLAVIQAGHKASLPQAREWLLQLAPALARIRDFTDKDETGALPRELADTLAEVAPNLLPAYYLWLETQEEFSDAIYAFRVFLGVADLSSPINQAVAKTAADEGSLRVLSQRADAGDEGARTALESLIEVLGQDALREKPEEGSDSDSREYKREPPPPAADYPPTRFGDYLKAMQESRSYWSEDGINSWAEHWIAAGRHEDVFKALEAAVSRGVDVRNYDRMFDLALRLYGRERAYPWLVKAHKEGNGWYSYWTPKEEAVRRWEIIKQYYPERWLEFIKNTKRSDGERPWDGVAIGHMMFKRLVQYCYFMGQRGTAELVSAQIVRSSLELVSPLMLAVPEWTRAYDEQH